MSKEQQLEKEIESLENQLQEKRIGDNRRYQFLLNDANRIVAGLVQLMQDNEDGF